MRELPLRAGLPWDLTEDQLEEADSERPNVGLLGVAVFESLGTHVKWRPNVDVGHEGS